MQRMGVYQRRFDPIRISHEVLDAVVHCLLIVYVEEAPVECCEGLVVLTCPLLILFFFSLYFFFSCRDAPLPGCSGSVLLKFAGFLLPEKTPIIRRSKKVLMMCIMSGQKSQIMSNLFKTDKGDQWLMPVWSRGWVFLFQG